VQTEQVGWAKGMVKCATIPHMIIYEDFKKVEITIGEIKEAVAIEKAEKLLLLTVDFAEEEPRTIVSGIKAYFPDPQTLVGKKVGFVTNLDPRPLMGYMSQGMILAANATVVENEDENESTANVFSLMEVSRDIPAGTKIS